MFFNYTYGILVLTWNGKREEGEGVRKNSHVSVLYEEFFSFPSFFVVGTIIRTYGGRSKYAVVNSQFV